MPEIVCGGVKYTPHDKEDVISLNVHGDDANVELVIDDIENTLMSNIPPVLLDLLEVAAYVYCADQRTKRGENTLAKFGQAWIMSAPPTAARPASCGGSARPAKRPCGRAKG